MDEHKESADIFYEKRADGSFPYVKQFTAHALIDIKATDNEKRIIEGYASTKHEDRDDDVILPEAFEDSAEAYLKDGVVLLFHDSRAPVGKPLSVKQTATGIKLKTQILEGFEEAEKAWAMIKAGAIRAYSIGFRTLDARFEDRGTAGVKKRYRVITSLEWIETSLVSIPSNRHSFFSVTKGLNTGSDLRYDVDAMAPAELKLDETTKALRELNDEVEVALVLNRMRELNRKLRTG
jgi:HK97 family phage prohead protease